MNVELLQQKEKLYADYRSKIEEFEAVRKQVKQFNAVLQACHTKMDQLEREVQGMTKLIEYMIRNDLDPVTAKLKWSEDYESKVQINSAKYPYSGSAAMASSSGLAIGSVGSVGSIASAPYTYHQMSNSSGITAQEIDDLFKDINKYDSE